MTGSGTPADPYVIWDVNDLQNMNLDLTAYYELGQDIDASATSGWNGGLGFDPVGPDTLNKFEGELDGKGYVITDIFISRPAAGVGLFGRIGGVVKNIGLVNCDITGLFGGSLAAGNHGTVTNCYSTGIFTGLQDFNGGLVGYNYGTIECCYSECVVNVTGGVGGGGGLIGSNAAGATVNRSFAIGDVTSAYHAGGFCSPCAGTIQNCYARGRVESTGVGMCGAAGFVTTIHETTIISNCYCANQVIGPAMEPYGFCRIVVGPTVGIQNSFWDTELSGIVLSVGATGKTTSVMKTESTFTGAGWDFATIWDITPSCNNDYPCLLSVTPSCGVPVAPFVINKSYALSREEL